MRFFTSDTHFGHQRIIELCDRPFTDIYHMDEMLIANWNDVVGYDDTVYHLGDVALGSWERWDNLLSRLNGHKILVEGNHDRIFEGNKPAHRARFEPVYAQWFEHTTPATSIEVGGRVVLLSHFPYDGDSHGEDRYESNRLLDKGVPLIHGHTHSSGNPVSRSARGTPQFHVGVDAHNYRPVSEIEIESWIRSL